MGTLIGRRGLWFPIGRRRRRSPARGIVPVLHDGRAEVARRSRRDTAIAAASPVIARRRLQIPLFCGQNRLIVTCENGKGTSVRVSDPIMAAPCAAGAIRATLTWDECGSDHELHIVRNGSQLYDPANDCTWNACTYGGGLDWPPMVSPRSAR